ncbi:hypothetical protein ABPG72_013761 [Tetrahymena utriculariae]
MAKIEMQNGYSSIWMSHENINQISWNSQYIASFYFMTVTMITVGFGDILQKNDAEMILSISTMIFASGVFGYCLNQVGGIFNNFFFVGNQIKKKLLEIQKYMSKKNIDSNLQLQIREYLEYYRREQSEMSEEQEQDTIQKLSESLRSKLLFEANKIVLQDSPIFKQNFSKQVIEQTVPLIHQIKYTPENDILVRGVQDDQSIYFIENGSVEVILDAKQTNSQSIYILKKGQSFGEYTFFTSLPRVQNIRSREFTTVIKISRQDFLTLLSRFPEDAKTFCSIKDQITYLDDYSKVNLKCMSCHSLYHYINDCQYLHYFPKKARIIKSYNDLINIENLQRQKYDRRDVNIDYHFKNSKVIHFEVVKQLQMYLELNQSILDSDDVTQYSEGYQNIDKIQNNNDKSSNKYFDEFQKTTKVTENDCNSQNYLIQRNNISKFGTPKNKAVNIEEQASQSLNKSSLMQNETSERTNSVQSINISGAENSIKIILYYIQFYACMQQLELEYNKDRPSEYYPELLQIFQGIIAQIQKNQKPEYYFLNQSISSDVQNELQFGFDKMKQFKKYNPRFNYSSVIGRFNHLQDQRRKLLNKKTNRNLKIRQTVLQKNLSFKNSDSQFHLRRNSKNQTNSINLNEKIPNQDAESLSSNYVNANTNIIHISDVDRSAMQNSDQNVQDKNFTQIDKIIINLKQIQVISDNFLAINSKFNNSTNKLDSPLEDYIYQSSDLNNNMDFQNCDVKEESRLSCIPYEFNRRKSNFQNNFQKNK